MSPWNWSDLHLRDPWWLTAWLVVGYLGFRALRRRPGAAVFYSEVSLLRLLPRTAAQRVRRLLPWLRVLALALGVLALSRPRAGQEEFRIRRQGIAILMCLDRSGSMETPMSLGDTQMTRLDAVRQAFRLFVTGGGPLGGRPDDLLGLVTFTGYAEARCPLTLDHHALLELLDGVQVARRPLGLRGPPRPASPSGPTAELGGELPEASIPSDPYWAEERLTAIGDAIVAAVDRLKDAPAKSRVIILFSDGEQTAGVVTPAEAAQAAKNLGIRIYTIGIEPNQATLREIAEITGGRAFTAADPQALQDVYREIDQLEKTPTEGRLYTQYRELYGYALWPAVGLIVLELVLSSTRFRTLP